MDEMEGGMEEGAQSRLADLHCRPVLTLHTKKAQALVRGRRADPERELPPVIGLIRFAAHTNRIWSGAKGDDPYADQWLLRVEQALDAAAQELARLRGRVEPRLGATPGVYIPLGHSAAPASVPLSFANAYAFQGAYLLAQFDQVMLAILTARQVALITAMEADALGGAAVRAVRRAFASAVQYRPSGLTRSGYAERPDLQALARERMGRLDPEVYAGKRRPRFTPRHPHGIEAVEVTLTNEVKGGFGPLL